MKTSRLRTTHSNAIIDGWVDALSAGADSGGAGGSVVGVDVENGDAGDLAAGDVVVLQSDGSVAKTTTAQYTGKVGVVLDDIAVGEFGAVAWAGPVDVVNVTSSTTGGEYLQTSTTAGSADASATALTGSFGQVTGTGTTPSAFLFGGGSSSTGGSGSATVFDHGNMGSTETVDLADGTWHRGTLNAACTITVTGFTVDEGLVVVFEVTQDGTGGWGITWDPDVVFIGDDQPDLTAGGTTVFLLFSSAGDTLIYGARVGGGGGASATDAFVWRPLIDTGTGDVIFDSGTGNAIMAFTAI